MFSIFQNYILLCAMIGWFSAQLLKPIILFFFTGKFETERLVGAGGMPSSHTAMVCALTVATARSEGMDSAIFAVCFVFACVVMYDAMGVRRAAGMHAKAINELRTWQEETDEDDDDDFIALQEKLGHTPLEVLGGALLGILIPMVVGFFM
ncbi:MAG: divergent PAP2 family protein [Clostridia bacterium]|nr:divergent PAP2 family protein [Clostridia bacterium]